MGFDITTFFMDLDDIRMEDIDEIDMLAKLEACIDEAKVYARECGIEVD